MREKVVLWVIGEFSWKVPALHDTVGFGDSERSERIN
jgi:hypothetical protein